LAKLLIVDDDPLIRETLGSGLRMFGHDVALAEDGAKGVAHLRCHAAELALVDILMPEKEGLETIREMRRDHPTMRIIAMSGGGGVSNLNFLEMAQVFGADLTLQKPFRIKELLESIASLLAPLNEGG